MKGSRAHLKIDGRWCCLDCRSPVEPNGLGGVFKANPGLRCRSCAMERHKARTPIQVAASTAVGKAVRLGHIPPARECICVDCGKPAEHYDHRDYDKPLDVVPVCRRCNFARGPAAGLPGPETYSTRLRAQLQAA